MVLKSVNDQQEGWRLRLGKLVLREENDCKNRGGQYWKSIRHPFDDFPYQHVTHTSRDRLTSRTLEVVSKITAGEGAECGRGARTKLIFLSARKLLNPDAFLKGVVGVKEQFDQL